MSVYKFKEQEIFVNSLRLYPKYEFTIYSGTMFINNQQPDSGSFNSASLNVPSGYISLLEKNIDKLSGSNNFIYPFITKDGSLQSFATVSANQFANSIYGTELTGTYPMSSSIYRNYYSASQERRHVRALENTLNHYINISPHYEYSGSLGNKDTQDVNLISIPSIFYGRRIKKGTVDLKFYITGTLIGQLQDINKNGELIQTAPEGSQGSGSVAGVVLYTEGFVLLTGSWNLDTTTALDYTNNPGDLKYSQWRYWGSGITGFDNTPITASHTSISFQGETNIPTITMYAHAPRGDLNHSNNPTFLEAGQSLHSTVAQSGSLYTENDKAVIKNTVFSPYDNNEEPFEKHTYISKVAIYDENMNVLGVAKIAKPVKKTEDREFSFKLKIDI